MATVESGTCGRDLELRRHSALVRLRGVAGNERLHHAPAARDARSQALPGPILPLLVDRADDGLFLLPAPADDPDLHAGDRQAETGLARSGGDAPGPHLEL